MDRKGFAIMAATGVVKIICNAGYLWIAPDAIGQHRPLVVHIKHCKGATVPQEGDKVMFDRRWNDTKGEYDIVNCKVTSGGGGTGQVVAFGGGDTSFINNTIIDADPLKLFSSSSSSSSAVPRPNRSRSPRNASDADDAYSNTDKGNNNAKDEGNGNGKGTGEDREVQANANDKGRNAKDKGNNNATFQYHWIAVHQIQCDMMSEPAPS